MPIVKVYAGWTPGSADAVCSAFALPWEDHPWLQGAVDVDEIPIVASHRTGLSLFSFLASLLPVPSFQVALACVLYYVHPLTCRNEQSSLTHQARYFAYSG